MRDPLDRGRRALAEMIAADDVVRVLDIGSGTGAHAAALRSAGKDVVTIDNVNRGADFVGDYLVANVVVRPFDGIWCCHVLEHQRNIGQFLDKIVGDVKHEGMIAITVPPLKHQIVGGHVSLWNPGLLAYHMILAGLNLANASVYVHGYNISIVVRKTVFKIPTLISGPGDIEALAAMGVWPKIWSDVSQGFDGYTVRATAP